MERRAATSVGEGDSSTAPPAKITKQQVHFRSLKGDFNASLVKEVLLYRVSNVKGYRHLASLSTQVGCGEVWGKRAWAGSLLMSTDEG